jgi:hypothetical protein
VLLPALVLVFWTAGIIRAANEDITRAVCSGAGGYSADTWRNHKLAGYLREKGLEGFIYTNCAPAVEVLAGRKSMYLPKKQGLYMYGLNCFHTSLKANGRSYIAWFNGMGWSDAFNIEDLKKHYDIKILEALPDGTLYLINNR